MVGRENSERDFIIIGGCHVSGFGAEGSPSFIDIVESNLNLKCKLKKTMFQLKNVTELESILDCYCSDLVFLQVGNYEFDGSIKTLLSSSKKKSNSVSNSSPRESSVFSKGRSSLYFSSVSILRWLLIPVIWMNTKRKNSKYLFSLQEIIKKNTEKTFVIISPLPCYYTPSSIVRRNAGVYYKNLFTMQNAIFVDVFDEFEIIKTNFYDRHHLSAKGHEQLGQIIVTKLLSTIKSS